MTEPDPNQSHQDPSPRHHSADDSSSEHTDKFGRPIYPAPGASDGARSNQPGGYRPVVTSGLAIAALIVGIIGICVPGVGVIGLILGLIAINQIDNPANRRTGRGMATAGAITGGIGIVTALLIPLLIGILLPALNAARHTARQLQNSTQARGIHQGMVTYAQGNKAGGGVGWFPGLNPQGSPMGISAKDRFAEMLSASLFTPDYVINPLDNKQPWTSSGPLTSDHYSYALLDISDPGGRRDEWAETLNTLAIVLGDRDIHEGTGQAPASVWTDGTPGDWRGTITRNDNSTAFETNHQGFQSQYGSGPVNQNDNIFQATGSDDAVLIYEGQ